MGEPTTADLLAKLHAESRIPPAELVGKVDKGYAKLDYVGHAAVTDILLATDPLWSWEPVAWTERGMPAVVLDKDGWPVGLWIRLTVHGHARLGYGTCPPGKTDGIKELIGDALRNAAMRFGVALSLWAKEEWPDLEAGEDSQGGSRTQTATSGKEEQPTDNAARPANVSTLPAPSDSDVARHPSAGGPLLRQDQAIAARARQLGLDDETRLMVIQALTGKTSGKDITSQQVTPVMRNMQWLADGLVELRIAPDGTPELVDKVPANPGPGPGQRVDG